MVRRFIQGKASASFVLTLRLFVDTFIGRNNYKIRRWLYKVSVSILQVFLFANSKCKRYFHNQLKPAKLTWTAKQKTDELKLPKTKNFLGKLWTSKLILPHERWHCLIVFVTVKYFPIKRLVKIPLSRLIRSSKKLYYNAK